MIFFFCLKDFLEYVGMKFFGFVANLLELCFSRRKFMKHVVEVVKKFLIKGFF